MKRISYEKPSLEVTTFDLDSFLCASVTYRIETDEIVNTGLTPLNFNSAEEVDGGTLSW